MINFFKKTTLSAALFLTFFSSVGSANEFAGGWDDSQAKAEGRIWVDKETNVEYEYIGVLDYYAAQNKCKAIGRSLARFKASHVNPYAGDSLEPAALRLMQSPLKTFFATKYQHAPGYAFWLTVDYYGHSYLAFSYEDEPNDVRVILASLRLMTAHAVCASRL